MPLMDNSEYNNTLNVSGTTRSIYRKTSSVYLESNMTVNELKQKRNVNNPAKNFHTLEIKTSQKELNVL